LPEANDAATLQASFGKSFAIEPYGHDSSGAHHPRAITDDPEYLELSDFEDETLGCLIEAQNGETPAFDLALLTSLDDLIPLKNQPCQPKLSLTNLRPSRLRRMDTMEAGLDHRIARLWDTGQVFTATDPDFRHVTRLFAQTYTDLFRLSCTMAEAGVSKIQTFLSVAVTTDGLFRMK
jgi:hypothetical protein